jgi:hypothetical protein
VAGERLAWGESTTSTLNYYYRLYPDWNGMLSGVSLEIGNAGLLELEKVQVKITNAMLTVECFLSHTRCHTVKVFHSKDMSFWTIFLH